MTASRTHRQTSLPPWAFRLFATVALAGAMAAGPQAAEQERVLAITCAKALTCAEDREEPQIIDRATLLVRGGRITAIGPREEIEVPDGAERLDLGDAWILPGLLDLHSHIGHRGIPDWNDGVYQANPGLRVSSSVVPANALMRRAVAGGVTTLLYIPGSGTNIGGQGILLKTAPTRFEDARITDPGALKLAQAGNPESWTIGMGRSLMNHTIRDTLKRGLAYARAWRAFEDGDGVEPDFDPQWEIFRSLAKGEISIAAHTQIYQIMLATLTMVKRDMDLPVFIDHGTFDGWRTARLAAELQVPAILGPRTVVRSFQGWYGEADTDGRTDGIAAKYQEEGHEEIGFNTDAIDPDLVPDSICTEDLATQAAMSMRYGFDGEDLLALRGLTIVPARTVGIEDRLGSLEVGKDADLIVVSGDPTDPRQRVLLVLVEGEVVHDAEHDPHSW